MNPQETKTVLDLFTHDISSKAIKDAEQFLENTLPGKGVEKERLLTKVLFEEQQVEYNRKMLENLTNETKGLSLEVEGKDLRSVEELVKERESLQKRRREEHQDIAASHHSIEEILRMKRETEALRNTLMNQRSLVESAKKI